MQHLIGNKGMFETLKALKKRQENRVGNKHSPATEGVGEARLRCVRPDGKQLVILKEVYYVPYYADLL